MPPKATPRQTLDVIAAAAGTDQVIVAGELVEVRFPDGAGLSLLAAKLFHVLLDRAGVAIVEDREHELRLAEVNWCHGSLTELQAALRELQTTVIEITFVDQRTKERRVKSGQFLTDIERPQERLQGVLNYRFSHTLRWVVKHSQHWAAVSARAVLAMEGKYSVRLYQMLALYVNRRQISETFELEDLRARLGISTDTLPRWPDFRRRVIEPAVAEINHLTGFMVEAEAVTAGRRVSGVRFSWAKKDRAGIEKARRELDRPRVGRKARREMTVEEIAAERQQIRAEIAESLASLPGLKADTD